MKVLLLQHTLNDYYNDMVDLTHHIHSIGCSNHKYDYELNEHKVTFTKNANHEYWLLPLLLSQLREKVMYYTTYDVVVWLDADTYWDITKPLIPYQLFRENQMFAATWHRDHFNIGCLWVNWQHRELTRFLDTWLVTPDNEHVHRSQHVFNTILEASVHNFENHRNVQLLGHEYNSVQGHKTFQSQIEPVVYSWHGVPNRIEQMREFLFDRS
jgi:hypothetical protein